ncbi:MAG: hypothetical protein CMO80_01235 [Verrucomicrobiales bacterium]|nr:hypothetical protein [Verrucomicrobiales bacterium]|tara:strand:+ start:6228 stop:7394 length:1167 start_codon:yes stop_codon:yes gene_type:complete
MQPTIAYLALGKVRIKEPGKNARLLESPFASTIHDRSVRSQQRHSWKSSDGGGVLSGPMLWGGNSGTGPAPVLITSICRGTEDKQLVYSLTSGSLCALLQAENLGEEEKRIWNDNRDHVIHVDTCPASGNHCFSVQHENVTANIGVKLKDESGISEVTEGDSMDTAPRWVPGDERRIVYQSAGVGRNQDGDFGGFGPFGIELLNVDTAELRTLAHSRNFDFLAPRMTENGDLHYIRRPRGEHDRIRPFNVIKDFFLLPFRILFAIFQWMNIFSQMYTGKKLSTAGGPKKAGPDMKQMRIWGNVIAAQRNDEDQPAELVPSSWQLVHRKPNGQESTLAKAVLSYDIAPDGTIIYSTGSKIFSLGPTGKKETILSGEMIEQVVVIPEAGG